MKKAAMVFWIWIVFLAPFFCMGQTNDKTNVFDWGDSVKGIRLSIAMTNLVWQNGASASVSAVTTNSSTNGVEIATNFPGLEFDILIKNQSGKRYHVATPLWYRGPRGFIILEPKSDIIEAIPVTFGKTVTFGGNDIDPGEYTLTATRSFTYPGQRDKFYVFSNPLRIQVK